MADADTYARDVVQKKPSFIKKPMQMIGGTMTGIINFFISLF